MKKIVVSALAALCLVALFGCNHRAETQALQPTAASETLTPMQQSWRGVLPCADCEGIETSLFLEKDGTWVMNERYLGAREATQFASYGTWARTADRLILSDSDGEKRYFRVKGDRLEMLDHQGMVIKSALNYTLAPVNASLPATPVAMRGMYFYMADAAVFTDCATGRRFTVSSNARLERDYAAARDGERKPLLLVTQAHFVLQPNPESGATEKALVVDGGSRFETHKNCDDQ